MKPLRDLVREEIAYFVLNDRRVRPPLLLYRPCGVLRRSGSGIAEERAANVIKAARSPSSR